MALGGFFGRGGKGAPRKVIAVAVAILVVRVVALNTTARGSAVHWVLSVVLTLGLVWLRWFSPWGRAHLRRPRQRGSDLAPPPDHDPGALRSPPEPPPVSADDDPGLQDG